MKGVRQGMKDMACRLGQMFADELLYPGIREELLHGQQEGTFSVSGWNRICVIVIRSSRLRDPLLFI
jgi:hypothetical protein